MTFQPEEMVKIQTGILKELTAIRQELEKMNSADTPKMKLLGLWKGDLLQALGNIR